MRLISWTHHHGSEQLRCHSFHGCEHDVIILEIMVDMMVMMAAGIMDVNLLSRINNLIKD
jgi:hypothetical protein